MVTTGAHVGWGGANVAPQLTGQSLPDMMAAFERLDDALRGRDPRDLVQLVRDMERLAPEGAPIRAAIDMALHDAVAREQDVAAWRLLRGAGTPAGPYLASVDPGEPGATARCAEYVRAGVALLKLKVANQDVEREVAFAREARARFGEVIALANAGWTPAQAAVFCTGVSDLNLAFIEQPLPGSYIRDKAGPTCESVRDRPALSTPP